MNENETPLIHRDNIIQHAMPAAFSSALCHPVLPGTSEGGPNRVHLQPSNDRCALQPVFRISIEDQLSRRGLEGVGFTQLLNDPAARRVPCDVEVQNTPAIMANPKEAVEHTERLRRNCKEIHRGDGSSVVSEKGEPALGWIDGPWGAVHPARDHSLGNIEPERQQFPVEAWCAPRRY